MDTVLRVTLGLIAGCLAIRLAGMAPTWLPGTLSLLLLLVFLQLGRVALRRDAGTGVLSLDHWWTLITTRRFYIVLAALSGAGLAIRFTGLGTDLYHIPINIDEGRLALSVRHFLLEGEIDHSTVEHYPGILYWILCANFIVMYVAGIMSGAAERFAQIRIEEFVLVGRATSVLIDTGTIVIAGFLGRRVGGDRVGLLSALVVAVSPLAVQISAQFRNDSMLTLLVTATTLAALWSSQSQRSETAIGPGVLAGLAAAVKYSGVFALVPAMVAAVAIGGSTDRMRRLVLSVLGFGVALALTNHYLWADMPNFLRQLGDQIAITGEGHYAARDNPAWFYVVTIGDRGTGWAALGLAAVLLVRALAGRRAELWILVAFPLCYLWFMPQRPAQFPRWVYPMVPSVAVCGSWMVWTMVEWLQRQAGASSRMRAGALAVAVVVLLTLAQPLWISASDFSRRVTPATHQLARTWLEENVSAGDVVLVETGWLDLSGVEFEVRRTDGLSAVLEGSADELRGVDWVVVHERQAAHPRLEQLRFVQRFLPDRTFGGNRGFDFYIYAPPARLP